MTFLVVVKTSEMTQILAIAGNIGDIDAGGWDRVFLGSF